MALIEYFAFDAQRTNSTASLNFRKLARYGFQSYVYDALRYVPPDSWRFYQDRVSILSNAAPVGYFIIYNEVSGLVADLIRLDLVVNDETIPDISVGSLWATYWKDNNLKQKHGKRIPFHHNYPSYYRQAASNPQSAWAYPEGAIPQFRQWFRELYLPSKFPNYILRKAHALPGGEDAAKRIALAFSPKAIEAP